MKMEILPALLVRRDPKRDSFGYRQNVLCESRHWLCIDLGPYLRMPTYSLSVDSGAPSKSTGRSDRPK